MSTLGTHSLLPVQDQRPSKATMWALAAVALMFGLAYAPNFYDLQNVWNADPNYSHGYLIIPIALIILWRRLTDKPPELPDTTSPALWWGWIVLSAVLALRAIAYEWSSQWVETATLLPVIACLLWTFGGWPLLRRAWPAIVFLVFLFPLPPGVNGSVALPLQRIATTGSCFLLQLSGLWAVQQGNVIQLTTSHGVVPLDVALACNGLRMLMTMTATITATIILVNLATWKRIVLLVSTIPIALLSNMIRIVTTGWCYYKFEGPRATAWAHDVSGWLMMPLALLLVGLELQLLSWLTTDNDDDEKNQVKLLLPRLGENRAATPKRKSADLDDLA
jgi:exosortase